MHDTNVTGVSIACLSWINAELQKLVDETRTQQQGRSLSAFETAMLFAGSGLVLMLCLLLGW